MNAEKTISKGGNIPMKPLKYPTEVVHNSSSPHGSRVAVGNQDTMVLKIKVIIDIKR